MRARRQRFTIGLVLLGLGVLSAAGGVARAQTDDFGSPQPHAREEFADHDGRNDRVSLGHDADLPAGQTADSVVSVGGSASSEGEARQDVVSVFGNTRVAGVVGHDAVAVLGDTYVNSHIGGDAVAVLGDVQLGPQADVEGNVVTVGGTVHRDPMAIVHGSVQQVAVGSGLGAAWTSHWTHHRLGHWRPFAWWFGFPWVWILGLGALVLYVCLALIFPAGIERCAQTFEHHPGQSILAAVLAVLLTPVLLLLLVITLIGIAAVPLVVLALLCASAFGKASLLAWVGQRCLGAARGAPRHHPALAVLIGGLIVLALYLVPVLGVVIFQLLGLIGLGVAIQALLISSRERRGPAGPAAPPVPPVPPGPASQTVPPAPTAASAVAAEPPVPPAASPVPTVPTGPYAGFWVRIAALLIDALLVGFVVHLLPHGYRVELLALAAYGAIMWKLRGTTIGGIVFGLQVVRLDGRPVDWTTAVVRALGCFLSLAIVGLGFLWIAFDDCKQAWHDKFAGTVVLRAARAPSLV